MANSSNKQVHAYFFFVKSEIQIKCLKSFPPSFVNIFQNHAF